MENWHDDRNKIIGLGEHSFRKSYYPELYNVSEQEITNYSVADISSKSMNIADLPIIWKEVELHKTQTIDWTALQIGTNKEFPVQMSINLINWYGTSDR